MRLAPKMSEAYLARRWFLSRTRVSTRRGWPTAVKRSAWLRENAQAWCARGTALYLLGQYGKSLADLSRAIELKPDYDEASKVFEKGEG